MGSSSDGIEGDEDESSSSSLYESDPLKSFREQWQKELQISPKHATQPQSGKVQALDTQLKLEENRQNVISQISEDDCIETKVSEFGKNVIPCFHMHYDYT